MFIYIQVLMVSRVTGGGAFDGRLSEGDVVLKVGGRPVTRPQDIVAIFYPFSQFCGINTSLLSLQKQPNTAQNIFQRRVEYGKYAGGGAPHAALRVRQRRQQPGLDGAALAGSGGYYYYDYYYYYYYD